MKLRLPTPEQLQAFYNTHMKEAFPPAELKPLSAIERMWRDGWYKPYCLYDDDGEEPIGCAFLWLGHEGWSLLDYLCVTADRRNDGLGAVILRLLPEVERDAVIFGEAEVPEDAPDVEMARRRLGFYARCGLKTAGYETEIFGVHYKTLYLSDKPVDDEELLAEHKFVYQNTFTADKYEKYVRIPYDPAAEPAQQVAWDQ